MHWNAAVVMCVGGDPDVIVCSAAAPKTLPAHLKESKNFYSYFCHPHNSALTPC